MPVEIVTIACLTDNYAFLLHDAQTGRTGLVDAPEAAPIEAALADRGWELDEILLTHHHNDHIAGVAALRGGSRVIGAAADAHRLPPLDLTVAPGDTITTVGGPTRIIDAPGHTRGHVAFYMPEAGAVFTGDSLMALGCGRLFEGTAAEMWATLSAIAALPPETLVYSGHEYTAGNARFALSLDAGNEALLQRATAITATRAAGGFTVPSRLADELATNPFLRADSPALRAATGLVGALPAEVLAEIRKRKDSFR